MSGLEAGIDRLHKIQVGLLELLEEAHDILRAASEEDPRTAGVLNSAEAYWLKGSRMALTRDHDNPRGSVIDMGDAIAALERVWLEGGPGPIGALAPGAWLTRFGKSD